MGEMYKSIDSLFYSKRPEINFDENLLNQLEENERRNIESKIVRLCQNGYEDCYKYIPFLKYEDAENKLNIDTLKKFSSLTQTKAFYYLLVKTDNPIYIEELKEVCDDTILAYTWLLHSIKYNKLDEKHREELKEHLKARASFVENDPNGLCLKIYKRELKSNNNDSLDDTLKTYEDVNLKNNL